MSAPSSDWTGRQIRQDLGTHLPKLVFVLAFLPGLAMTVLQHSGAERRLAAEFDRVADQAIDRVLDRLQQHVVVLKAAHGFFVASQDSVSRQGFDRFLSSVDISATLSGVQGIGFARMLPAGSAGLAQVEVQRNYGLSVDIRPATDQAWRTPIVLLLPDNDRNHAALGFDMFAEPVRRSAMEHAIASQAPQMTGPVELVQEITADKQTGFLIYLPFTADAPLAGAARPPVTGFIYAAFRGGDLIDAGLAAGTPLPVRLRVADSGAPDHPLFDASAGADTSLHRTRTVEILGRQWVFDVWSDGSWAARVRYLNTALIGLISLLFAAATAYATASRQTEALQARALAAASAREADNRQLLVLEMKHRLKNHIARIQSIARQSARGATGVQAFLKTFDARLQSMSAVQEILAGTVAASADVSTILARELQQSLDADEVRHRVDGPPVVLCERQAHALALVVHELVTNAMKYGGLSAQGRGLRVTWAIDESQGKRAIDLRWDERTAGATYTPSQAPGFGSRLIEASVKGELSGSLTRTFTDDGLSVRLIFPLDPGPGT